MSNAESTARPLPDGVRIVPLVRHEDERGSLVELYRQEWLGDMADSVQWNHVVSRPGVLRGIHVHHTHWDYLYMAQGGMELALVDVRRDSPDFLDTAVVHLDAGTPQAVIVPPGVAHGFWFPEPAILVYGVSHTWNPADELGCRWDDPALDLAWSVREPRLSQRDAGAGSLQAMISAYEALGRPANHA
ncbi:MAG: dTDP-4-dehydrorhamnose 3,5-epimerase family protein [Xanthomonadales bacterium]|nr:dTDP-4-dehydrorhamnose 3,5-epimerase family protein [Xanthomonadales bacterium]